MINKTFVPDHLPVESNAAKITLPFYHPITTAWDLADLDPAKSNDAPNLNLTVAGLILSSRGDSGSDGLYRYKASQF